MEKIEITSFYTIPSSERTARELIRHTDFPLTFPYDKRVKMGEGVLCLAIVNGNISGALTKRTQVNHKDLPSEIYVLYAAERQIHIDNDLAEAALNESSVGEIRNRTVRMSDSDHQYLSSLGNNNVSEGIREAIRKIQVAESKIFESTL